jgi:hypothetical protein
MAVFSEPLRLFRGCYEIGGGRTEGRTLGDRRTRQLVDEVDAADVDHYLIHLLGRTEASQDSFAP